ncbi:MAG: hypothetical protein LBI03_03260 [Clostridiales bacterium]|jgi:hypothetical protein|nr:hypothetical protein [Clostridiales bacterium]
MFISLVAGTLIGMGGMIFLLNINTKGRSPKEKQIIQKHEIPVVEPDVLAETDPPEVSLTRKMPGKDFSLTDFNCAADGVDAEIHIASRQQHQDDSYNTLKQKKE